MAGWLGKAGAALLECHERFALRGARRVSADLVEYGFPNLARVALPHKYG